MSGSWKDTKLPSGSQLIQIHSYTFIHGGKTYSIEIDEYSTGPFTGHAEGATDKSLVIESVTGNTQQECLELLIQKIKVRD